VKKLLLSLLVVHGVVFGMEQEDSSSTSSNSVNTVSSDIVPYQLKDVDRDLWRAINHSNYNAALTALSKKANQNYLWPKNDDTHKEYADLTPVMYAVKRLRAYNRRQYASVLGSAVAWDIGKAVFSYALSNYAQQYPVINYVEPVWNSRTMAALFGSSSNQQPVVETYNPAKRLLYDLLIKKDTDLTVKREEQSQGNSVTVLTYLDSMLKSWNPLTRDDGRDLSYRLSRVQRDQAEVGGDQQLFMGFTRPFVSSLNFDNELREGGQIVPFSNLNSGQMRSGGRLSYYAVNTSDY
jgi:hypothetical protein